MDPSVHQRTLILSRLLVLGRNAPLTRPVAAPKTGEVPGQRTRPANRDRLRVWVMAGRWHQMNRFPLFLGYDI